MFKRRPKEEPTIYDKQRALNNNQVLCFGAFGLLTYQFVQALIEEGKPPLWFLILMPAIIVGSLLIILRNFRTMKKMKAYITDMELAQKEQAAEQSLLLFDDSEDDETEVDSEVSKFDE